jgi:hypothetical protein
MTDVDPQAPDECDHIKGAECVRCGTSLHVTPDAPWRDGDLPDLRLATEAEAYVAGALSTMPPFDKYHPAEALPFAQMAIKALGNWEPTDG